MSKETGIDMRCPTAQAHQDVMDELHEIYVKKNISYGNSASASFDDFGIVSYVIRIGDKINRLKTIVKNPEVESIVVNETILDTLYDCANYCIMAVMDLRAERSQHVERG